MKITFLTAIFMLFLSGCSSVVEAPTENPDKDEVVEMPEEPEEPAETIDPETRFSFYGVGDNLIHSYIYQYAYHEDGHYDFKPIY